MYLHLHRLTIQLHSTATAVNEQWRYWFDGWLTPQAHTVHGRFHLHLTHTLPPLPTTAVCFRHSNNDLTVYTGENEHVWLHFNDGALLSVPLTSNPTITGYITPNLLQHGRLEDIFFTSLAPFLRRQGYFLLHAFAASHPTAADTAVLLVGPSGSGKTSTGLHLLLHGWQLLANDVVLLEAQPDGLVALPTPSGINIRPHTFNLLPTLASWLHLPSPPTTAVSFNSAQLTPTSPPKPARIRAIFFPHIDLARPTCERQPLNRAIALTQLLGESVDRWDSPTLASHIDHLQQLCQQTAVYQLTLTPNIDNLATRIASA